MPELIVKGLKPGRGRRAVWRKAAVLGSLWAASEIVLGSFLHNAGIPFSGEFLTAVGIAILVAGHRLWPERGLMWRAGIVCAAMKSVSPSAVILGPMIAISLEGVLLEIVVRLSGGNVAGYLLGGGLVMGWVLIYKTGSILLFYGPDAAALYVIGLEWLRSFTGLAPDNLYGPLLFLLALYFTGGLIAAVIGISVKYTGAGGSASPGPGGIYSKPAQPGVPRPAYSLWALVFHVAFVAAAMSAGHDLPPAAMCLATGAYAAVCAWFYRRAAALLKRPGVWGGILAVSLLAGLALGSPVSGLYMALRAFVLAIGFSAIGEELFNPAIRLRLERLCGSEFFDTLEQAFGTLPAVLNAMPGGAELVKSPVRSLGGAIARMPGWLAGFDGQKVFVITGGHGCGKSSFVSALAGELRASGKKPGGILSAGLWRDGARAGFDVIDLDSGVRTPLCRRGGSGIIVAGDFNFYEEGLSAGLRALAGEKTASADAVFVDELGFLELEGKGWAPAFDKLRGLGVPLVVVVRDYLLERIIRSLALERPVIWETGKTDLNSALQELLAAIEAAKK
ncbi:MAG: hypothetical protein A2X28_05610 [Elusimicrobia bacterium GWA2_56_46]|nr:MAG: hypothetical protein A2X28_05610 [Elusimicrobia bacterium GWA2_56_46]OGR53931.1 MAG: hypothetical protein A2X39_07305 [Elusimicrobia bacterium GWC2_56_31]HBB68083.1 hypothetical protein [Elusimicrobiota bacterium]HBW23217.1 hypothetical protein [Elusimicrobiota bacterium]